MIASSRKENSALISGFRFIDRLTLRNIFKDNENKESGDFVFLKYINFNTFQMNTIKQKISILIVTQKLFLHMF